MRTVIAAVILFTIPLCALAEWEPIGPDGGEVRELAIAPSNEAIMYVATPRIPAKIFQSTDAGNSWNCVSIIEHYANSIAVDPIDPDIVYIGSWYEVYKSTDGGETWTDYPYPGQAICGITVNPVTPSILYAAGTSLSNNNYVMTFFLSTDAGETWSATTLNQHAGNCYSLAIDPQDPNIIYIGGNINTTAVIPKVYKSTNGGSSFFDESTGIDDGHTIRSLAVHPTDQNIVYAGTFLSGIYRSTDGGNSWLLATPSSVTYIFSLAASITEPDLVYAGSAYDIYQSTDAGITWDTVSNGLSGYQFQKIAASQQTAGTAYTVNSSGVHKTIDAGQNWNAYNSGIQVGRVALLNTYHQSPSTLYVELQEIGVFRSTDNGTTWSDLTMPLTCGDLCAFAVHNTNPELVFAFEGTG
jgi:photosystem II stability/assembly factor-like uncharacterized protein